MTIAKAELYELEQKVHAARIDAQPVHEWLLTQQALLNARWPDATGDDLIRMQGEAKQVARLLRLIEDGPRIKQPSERAAP